MPEGQYMLLVDLTSSSQNFNCRLGDDWLVGCLGPAPSDHVLLIRQPMYLNRQMYTHTSQQRIPSNSSNPNPSYLTLVCGGVSLYCLI